MGYDEIMTVLEECHGKALDDPRDREEVALALVLAIVASRNDTTRELVTRAREVMEGKGYVIG